MRKVAAVAAAVILAAIAGTGAVVSAKSKDHQLKAKSVAVAWCSLKLGQATIKATAKLGKPHGHRAKKDVAAEERDYHTATVKEWDLRAGKLGKEPVLLVEPIGGKIDSLQAYANWADASNSSDPAHDLPCEAFRSPTIPGPTPTWTPTPALVVTFTVTGTAPDGLTITYGSNSANDQGGTSLPWSTTMPLGGSGVEYYYIDAQLSGAGTVSCSIAVKGKVIGTGSASGGYNIADCEITQGLFGGWQSS
jgi:hypothetical protein